MKTETILVVIDPTKEEQTVLSRSLIIAKALQARVELFEADYNTSLEASYPFDKVALEQARSAYLAKRRQKLAEYAGRFVEAGLQVSIHACWERPLYRSIVDRATQTEATLILKATHHHSLLNRALFTNTDWHLIRETPVPVWFVREEHVWDSHLELMAAVDPMSMHEAGQKLNPLILDWAHRISCSLPASLSVCHAYEPIPTGMLVEFDTVVSDYDGYRDQVKDEHQQALDELLKQYVESNTRVFFEESSPERFLPEIVEREGVDILIMGAVSRDGLDRLFIGSTAERVLEYLRCDVVIIK